MGRGEATRPDTPRAPPCVRYTSATPPPPVPAARLEPPAQRGAEPLRGGRSLDLDLAALDQVDHRARDLRVESRAGAEGELGQGLTQWAVAAGGAGGGGGVGGGRGGGGGGPPPGVGG